MEMAKPGAVLSPKRGAVVSQLVPKLKESVPPPPRGLFTCRYGVSGRGRVAGVNNTRPEVGFLF